MLNPTWIQHAQICIGIKFATIFFTYSVKNEVTMLNKSWEHFFWDTLYKFYGDFDFFRSKKKLRNFPNRVAIAVGNREAILVVKFHFSHT